MKQNKKNRKLAIILFISFFLIGSLIFKDYGVSSDEYSSRIKGFVTLKYLADKISPNLNKNYQKDKKIPEIDNYKQKIYGVVFEAPASFLEVIFNIKDKKNQFLLRHYLTFLIFFIATIYFFRILKIRFRNYKVSIIGTSFLILSPRIFANSFYNNKDLVFLSFFIITSFYAIKFIKKQNFKNSLKFSIFAALTIDIRILGVILPILTIAISFIKNLFNKKIKENFNVNLFTILFTIIFTILFWPYLWASPFKNFIFALSEMANFKIETYNLFFGEYINAKNVPWYFIPVWISITTPIIYLLLYLIGSWITMKSIFDYKIINNKDNIFVDLFFLGSFLSPLIAIIIFSSTLYNGWRQLYFIYPSLIYFSVIGCNYFFNLRNKKIFQVFFLILSLNLIFITFWMFKNHPHQYIFFNNIISKNNIHKKFDLDYWGLSYKENFEKILKSEKNDKIKIYNLSHNTIWYHLFSINEQLRNRFVLVDSINDADYLITNFFLDYEYSKVDFLNKFEIFNEILIDNNSINTVYKRID
jgi:hypothetical protein